MTLSPNPPHPMEQTRAKKVRSSSLRKAATAGEARTVLLVLACFLVGLGVGAFLIYRVTEKSPIATQGTVGDLSESTRSVLNALSAPVEIRFYSVLDPATTSEGVREFSGRVSQLLSAYEQEAGAKLKVTRQTSPSAAPQAVADGLKVFNLDKGEPCYLGLALTSDANKEVIPQLSPEWESALESDLSRTIARVAASKPAVRSSIVPSGGEAIDTNAIAEVKRAIPNLESMPLADAKNLLRAATLKEFTEAGEAMQRAVKEAEQRITDAKTGTEAEQQAAVKNLRQVQTEHNEKLKEITARLQSQISALEQIKQK